jgi:hypothetical protein
VVEATRDILSCKPFHQGSCHFQPQAAFASRRMRSTGRVIGALARGNSVVYGILITVVGRTKIGPC